MKRDGRLLGAWGEAQVSALLRKKGYVIRAANYRTRYGEIDLIAEGDGVLAFVEVKTRRDDSFARPTGLAYLAETGWQLPVRFDVAEVYAPEELSQPPREIRYLENVYTIE